MTYPEVALWLACSGVWGYLVGRYRPMDMYRVWRIQRRVLPLPSNQITKENV